MAAPHSQSEVASSPSVSPDRARRVLAGFDLVIFDCDGVLVDSEPISVQCLSDVLNGYGLATTYSDALVKYLGVPLATVAAEFQQATGRPLPQGFQEEWWGRLARLLNASLEPIPAIASVLHALATPFCLASSSGRARIDLSLEITGLATFFAGRIFDGSVVTRGKPAPDLFLHAAREMGAAPARTLVVEDSVNGVLAAKAAGMTAWGFLGGSHHAREGAEQLAAAGADRLFGSMTEFFAPGPRDE